MNPGDLQGKYGRPCGSLGQLESLGFATGKVIDHGESGKVVGFVQIPVHNGDTTHP